MNATKPDPVQQLTQVTTSPPTKFKPNPRLEKLPLFEKLIADNFIMVFSMTYCKHSIKAKELLQNKGLKFKVYEIDNNE